jgi:uncharacterized protein
MVLFFANLRKYRKFAKNIKMLVEFSVKNFKSIKALQTISFVAAPIVSKYKNVDVNNVFQATEKDSLLKTVGLYGANGSGKSNLIKALAAMTLFVKQSFNNDKLGSELVMPFVYDKMTLQNPTFFQIVFFLSGKKYRYGFEILGNTVVSEWLFGTAHKNEVAYFTRENQKIDINKTQFSEGIGAEKKTRPTNLFLNVADALNGQIAESVKTYLTDYVIVSSNDLAFRDLSMRSLEDKIDKQAILQLLNDADMSMTDLTKSEISESSKNNLENRLLSIRQSDDGLVHAPFDLHESEGTKKFFNYSSLLLAALKTGKVVILDEFDAHFHPLLSKKIITLFHAQTNQKFAQLLFVTHDTHLLDAQMMRRDQIYFVEKNQKGESSFYSLADFKGIRNDASFEKDYIKGKYGAIPFLGNFDQFIAYGI